MQKKIIALAIAGFASTAAFAADNVTLYGVADAYIGSFSKDGAQRSTQVNSGGLAASRIGFKGVEDLGSGLKALFVLEYRLDIDGNNTIGGLTTNNNQTGGARQQMIGLTGDFGTAVAGRLQTTAYDWAVKYDVLAGTAISPLQYVVQPAAASNAFLIGGTTPDARANNALAYISPNLSGVTLAANYSFAVEEAGLNNAPSTKVGATLLSVTYDNGPLSAGLVYDAHSADQAFYGISRTQSGKDWAFGASYNFGVATLKATYQTTKVADATGVAGNTDKAYSLGVTVPVTAAGTVVASYAKAKTDTDVTGLSDRKSWNLSYLQALSKRTTAYAGYQAKDSGAAVDAKSSALVAGVNHKF